MLTIRRVSPDAGFAAEELYKYLRMLLPRAGDCIVTEASGADGFRLGLLSDFGLDASDASDPALDDIVYLDCTPEGGIIAGSNRIALLIAVYRYLRFQGCRWLFPGVEGEYIPEAEELIPVQYRKKADHRYRGQCNEGAEIQYDMIDSIDFTPKIGMNTYMLEFDIPRSYYDSFYNHVGNSVRPPEPINDRTALQWKRACEVEIRRRGLHFHDMGHGWTAEPFGLDSKLRRPPKEEPPQEILDRMAMINGRRQLFGTPINTNFCMSNPENRGIVARYVADYAEKHQNVDFLHIWLADATKNHCECDECRKKTTSDWYLCLLNDIDSELERRNLGTHLVFIVYTETFWPPVECHLKNPARFTMLFAPIFRLYTETYGEKPDDAAVTPYIRNQGENPEGMAASLGFLDAWRKYFSGDAFCYEYHFWRHQYYDPSGLYLAELLHNDIRALHQDTLDGIVEDGSQRSFFPTGFAFYVYGETLFDSSVSLDELAEDYFSHAFGEDWRSVYEFLSKIRGCLDFAYLSGLRGLTGVARPGVTLDEAKEENAYYNPDFVEPASRVRGITSDFRSVIDANLSQPARVQTVSWQLLAHFCDYADLLSDAVAKKASGDDEGAKAAFRLLLDEFSRREVYIERCYDHGLIYYTLRRVFGE